MGIARATIKLLLDEAAVRPFSGSVLQLGRQAIFAREAELRQWAAERAVTLADDAPPDGSPLAGMGYLDDARYLGLLGFHERHSCDVADDEKPTFVFDLNRPVPLELHGRYDTVINGGTIEHVFDIATVLRNIFHLLKPGGRIIHTGPSSNHVDHGFYMFSPTLFNDYYVANRYTILSSLLLEYRRDLHGSAPWLVYDYIPGSLDHLSLGGFDRGTMLGIYFIARKEQHSTFDRIPQQSYYRRKRDGEAPAARVKPRFKDDPLRFVVSKISRELARWSRKLLGRRRRRRRMPDPIARY
jgi:SAM-dependent methyltransferase